MAKIAQYAYFELYSSRITPEAITSMIGLIPTETAVMGSMRSGPMVVPVENIWKLCSGKPDDSRLDDHFEALLALLSPHLDRIGALTEGGEVGACLTVVRRFEPEPEDQAVLERYVQPGFDRLRGQHPLVGFVLTPQLLRFLSATGASVDFDEYCDEYE